MQNLPRRHVAAARTRGRILTPTRWDCVAREASRFETRIGLSVHWEADEHVGGGRGRPIKLKALEKADKLTPHREQRPNRRDGPGSYDPDVA